MAGTSKPAARLLGIALLMSTSWATASSSKARPVPVLRWAEGEPGCTFSADDDGRYRYGLWTDAFGIVLAVDSQELQKVHRRTEPILTLHLTVRNRGKAPLAIEPSILTLEFVNHTHDLHPALDPNELAARFQADSDRLASNSGRDLQKHPEKKAELETALQERQQNIRDMLQFLDARSLRSLTLDPAHPESLGWIYFSASGKWIGDWKEQEEFVLRIPLANQVVEFPFELPPSAGDLLLRRR